MFTSARIKLTSWYLIIIMVISLSFSVVIYTGVRNELQRRFQQIELRLNLNPVGLRANRGQALEALYEDYDEARAKVLLLLTYANSTILIFSALAGYYLAGKTLTPIESALEEQKRFVADASHELKTPLTALQTLIEVSLRDKKLRLKDAKQTLEDSLEEIEHLRTLSNDLLMLARSQNVSQPIEKSPVDVSEIVNDVIKHLNPLATKKKVKLMSSVKPVTIVSNSDHLQKLITILVDNALKYTDKGSVWISSTTSRNYCTLSVKDTGIGISKMDLPHIYNRFFRADSARSKNGGDGFGLGLCLAKRITEDLDGKISVESTLGKGSTFTIKLPK